MIIQRLNDKTILITYKDRIEFDVVLDGKHYSSIKYLNYQAEESNNHCGTDYHFKHDFKIPKRLN